MKNWRGSFLILLIPAFLFLEFINFATNEQALATLLPGMTFGPFTWSMMLATAFALTDLTGLARVFTPETGSDEPIEIKILFWGWICASVFNAGLTWWGILNVMSNITFSPLLNRQDVLTMGPLIVAGIVFVVRICVVLTLSFSLDHLLNGPKKKPEGMPKQSPYQEFSRPPENHNNGPKKGGNGQPFIKVADHQPNNYIRRK